MCGEAARPLGQGEAQRHRELGKRSRKRPWSPGELEHVVDGLPKLPPLAEPDVVIGFWNGDPTVQMLEANNDLCGTLLKPCQPGYLLHYELGRTQNIGIVTRLNRFGSASSNDLQRFRHLSEMLKV